MPDPNPPDALAPVSRLLAARAAGNLAAMLKACSPDIALDIVGDPPHLPFAGRYQGHAGVREFLRRLRSVAETLAFEPVTLTAIGADEALVQGTEQLRFPGTGLATKGQWIGVFRLAGGRVASARFFSDSAAQLVAYRGY
jgi:ketosteroid isomerase-like protein